MPRIVYWVAKDPRSYSYQIYDYEANEPTTPDPAYKYVFRLLHRMGISNVSMKYQGSGDSSDDADFSFSKGDTFLESLPDTVLANVLEQQVEDICWEYAPPGFENNEGGQGTVDVFTATGDVGHEYHNWEYDEDVYDDMGGTYDDEEDEEEDDDGASA